MLADKRKVILSAALSGVSLWLVDALVDSVFFSRQSYLGSLLLDISAHELYFRTFFVLSFIVFGAVIASSLQKRKNAEEDLKRAIERLGEEKSRSEAIIAAIGDGISIQGRDMRVIFQNQAHKDMIGGDRRGEYCYRAYAGRDTVCEGCPLEISMVDDRIHVLEKSTRQGQNVRHIEIKSSALKDAKGRIVAGIEAVRDITERKETVEKLRLFSEAIEVAMDGVQIVGLDGRVVYSNKAIEDIYGFGTRELAGKHVNEMNEDRKFASRIILPAIEQTGRWSGEVSVLHKKGHTFPIWLAASVVKDSNGEPIAMLGIIRDITERKQAEEIVSRHRDKLMKLVEERTAELSRANQQLRKEMDDREKMEEELLKAQKLESIGLLAGGIAHDFNNLLASMLGNISLAMLDLDRAHPAFAQLAAAEKASLRAQDLTRQLLTFSKGGTPVKKTTDVGDLVRESAGFALRGSRIRCEISVESGQLLADVDEGQISQVIHNLVINADHAMPEGGTITIRCGRVSAGKNESPRLGPGEYIRISIEDQGVGIPREHLGKIFDPYFTTKQKGSGLGLATSYSIINKHGGCISVQSTLGAGSTFHVYVPAAIQRTLMKKTENASLQKGSGAILVMDDEPEVRETTGNVLKRLGYEVEYAADGQEAIEMYRKARESGSSYDLVIMDLTVPGGMGGKETIRKLMEIDPSIKGIVSSGYSNDPILADFTSYGFAGAVIKPFRLKDLSDEVHKVLNRNA